MKRKYVLGIIALIIVGVLIGLGARSASADVPSELGPVATVNTVKGVYGTQTTGFYVRYTNNVVRILPPIKQRLKDADDGAERFMVKHRYAALERLKVMLDSFAANEVL